MDRCEGAPQASLIQEMANILLYKRGTIPTQTVGVNWIYKIVKRHDELKTKYSRQYNYWRAECEVPRVINCVQFTIMQCGVGKEDICNFDETGFATA